MTTMTRRQIAAMARATQHGQIDAFDYHPATIQSLEACGWIEKAEEKWRGPAGWVGIYRPTESGHAALQSVAKP